MLRPLICIVALIMHVCETETSPQIMGADLIPQPQHAVRIADRVLEAKRSVRIEEFVRKTRIDSEPSHRVVM